MEGVGWTAVIQTGLLAIFSWYLRRGSKNDAAKVVQGTAAQSTSNEILSRVAALETDVALVKKATVKDCEIDHRGSPKG